jgi:uncharacterized protein (TIGR01777 family)
MVLGGNGFVARRLVRALQARGDAVSVSSLRDPQAAAAATAGHDAVVNLAGASVSERWSDAQKKAIADSRIALPHAYLDALAAAGAKPSVYVSASAIGYYGTSATATFTETSPPGDDFLARVCVGWETEARRAETLGMRVALIRTGLVLGTDGGALAKLLPIFKLGLGGPIGSGTQWYSWIHIDDLVGIYLLALDGASGPLNGTAPAPVTNRAFTDALGAALHRPAFLPVPAFAISAILGEGAVVVVEGQRVLPEATHERGYTFVYPTLAGALAALVS